MKEFSRARHNLRKELKPILQELKENKKQLINVSQINDKLRQQRRELAKQARSLRSAIQSLKQGQTTAKSNNPQALSPNSQKQGLHAVALALTESKSELHRNDFKKIVLSDMDNESELKPSVTNLRLKDLLTPSMLTEALRAKMSRGKETLELEVQGQAKLAHQPNASRRLAETVQSVGEQLKANAGPKTELTTKHIDQQLNLSLKAKDGMSM